MTTDTDIQTMNKFFQSLKIAAALVMARTFGTYLRSGWNCTHDYVQYRWRGRIYTIPILPDE